MQRIKNEKGFTLIEMMIVLLIISVLILIAIPNVTKHSKSIDAKGCAAYLKMAQGQVEAYKMDMKKLPRSNTVLSEEGTKEGASCIRGDFSCGYQVDGRPD